MYLRKVEKIYLLAFLFSVIAVLLYAVTTSVLALIEVITKGTILDNFLESFLMIICFIFLALAIFFIIEALTKRKGSYIMKTLTIDMETNSGKTTAKAIALVIAIIGLVSGIYFTLSYFGVPVYTFHFPIMLITCMMNWGYMLFVIGIYFFFYSNIYKQVISY